MSTLVIFFFSSDYIQSLAGGLNPFRFVIAFVGVNGLVEAAACFVVGSAITKALQVAMKINKRISVSDEKKNALFSK